MTTEKIWSGERAKYRWGCSPFAFLIWLSFLFAPPSFAADFGLDQLGLARHDARMIAEELPRGWWIGALDHTFGDPMPNLEIVANSGKLAGFRMHLRNTVCVRNRNCERTEPRYDDFEALGRDARKWAEFAQRKTLKCILSPWLEHDVKDRAKVERAVSVLRTNAPNCAVAVSAFTGYVPPGVLVEKHGNAARGDIISNDGHSLFDSDSPEYRKRGKVLVFGWINRDNGRVTGEKTFTPPTRRKNWPSRDDIAQKVAVLQPQQATPANRPAACKTARKLQGRELWKTNAEDYGTGLDDGRGNKGLLISQMRQPTTLDIIAPDGRKVGCAKYYGPFTEKGYHRHYVGSCSRETPIALMRKARSEWIYVKNGNNCIRVNAIRRKGYYRE